VQGALSDAFSFTVLTGVFLTAEPAAAIACAVSATGSYCSLLQVGTGATGLLNVQLAVPCSHVIPIICTQGLASSLLAALQRVLGAADALSPLHTALAVCSLPVTCLTAFRTSTLHVAVEA
jgi:hypothetical protein